MTNLTRSEATLVLTQLGGTLLSGSPKRAAMRAIVAKIGQAPTVPGLPLPVFQAMLRAGIDGTRGQQPAHKLSAFVEHGLRRYDQAILSREGGMQFREEDRAHYTDVTMRMAEAFTARIIAQAEAS